MKGKTHGLSKRQFNKTTKEIIILMILPVVIIMIIMNMQNKLYRIQFSHHLMTNTQSVPEQRSRNLEIVNFANVTKLQK